MSEKETIIKQIEEALNEHDLSKDNKDILINSVYSIFSKVNDEAELARLEAKLKILFEYEKHYLGLIKEYKEEIKFASQIQEDIRKERSQFFSQTLREVSETLQNAKVDGNVIGKWMQELVDSYTKSLDLSSELAKSDIIELNFQIKEEAKSAVKKASIKGKEDVEK